jgi:hypothetical protein
LLIVAPNCTDTIASETLNIAKLQTRFKEKSIFENRDIVQFYREFEPNVKETTVNWRVYTLVQAGPNSL